MQFARNNGLFGEGSRIFTADLLGFEQDVNTHRLMSAPLFGSNANFSFRRAGAHFAFHFFPGTSAPQSSFKKPLWSRCSAKLLS